MREIIFRGKRVDTGEWIEGFYACQSNHSCVIRYLKYQHFIYKDITLDFDLGGLSGFEIIPETVGQYTGLQDKNGKMIFEGDICIDSLGFTFTVKWDGSNARFLGVVVGEGRIVYVGREPRVEVIGNIYDNPDMLKGAE